MQLDASPAKVAASIKDAAGKLAQIEREIEFNSFKYGNHFPQSKKCALFGEFAPGTKVAIKELLDEYLAHIEGKKLVTLGTLATYKKLLDLYVRPTWDSRTVDKLTLPAIQDWIEELAAKGMVIKTCRNILIPLKRAMQRAVARQRIEFNPLSKLKLRDEWPTDQRETGYRPDPFNEQERQAILGACSSPEWQRFYTFWFWTGLRSEEIIALKWSEVVLETDGNGRKGYVRVCRVASEGRIEERTKTKSSTRRVPLFGPALKAILAQRASTQLKGHGFVWENPVDGKPWTDSGTLAGGSWRSLLKRAGVRHRGPYQCRHTFASMMFANAEPLATVSAILGHKNPGVTLNYYTRMIETITTANDHGFDLRGDYSKIAV
jgi:integrase